MDLSVYFPSVITYSPAEGDAAVDPQADITIRFSMAMAIPEGADELNALITLIDKSMDVPVAISFVSYDEYTHTLTIAPDSSLTPGVTYTVIVSRDVKAATGRAMADDYIWNFAVVGSPISAPEMTAPADMLTVSGVPTVSWGAVSGAATYQLQVSTWSTFRPGDIVYDTTTAATSVSGIDPSLFDDGRTYYARIRAISDDGTISPWSSIKSFTIDASPDPAPDSVVRPIFSSFGVDHTAVVVDPAATQITIVFNIAPDVDSADGKVVVVSRHVDGDSVAEPETIAGALSVIGTSLIFAPAEEELTIENRRFTVRLLAGITDSSGELAISEPYSFSFLGPLSPMYSEIETVRDAYGEFIRGYSDDEIAFQLHRSSIRCNRLVTGNSTASVADMLEEQSTITFDMRSYVETHTAYALIQAYRYKLLEEVDRKTTIDVYSSSTGSNILDDIAKILEELKDELSSIEQVIAGDPPTPKSGVRSSQWDPSQMYEDTSIANLPKRNSF